MKGFDIGIKNNLLDKKHIEQMGMAIWLFAWIVDRVTKEENGVGKVYGGKPIKYEDIKSDLGVPKRTYVRWLNILKKYKYIDIRRTPYGLVIFVNKTKKKGYANNGTSPKRDTPHFVRDTPQMAQRYATNGVNKLRQNKDITKDRDFSSKKEDLTQHKVVIQGKKKLEEKLGWNKK